MNYYQTLGLQSGASPEEIKKAYRKLASQHHPDKGGDTAKFQEIQAAYEGLLRGESGPAQPPNGTEGSFRFTEDDIRRHFGDSPFGNSDPFSNFFRQSRVMRNGDYTMSYPVTIEQLFNLANLEINVTMPNGSLKKFHIKLQPEWGEGTKLKFSGEGSRDIPNVPPGDLYVMLNEQFHPQFVRQGRDIVMNADITVWQAMLGSSLQITTIDSKILETTIKPGTQDGTTLRLRGYGMPYGANALRGDMLIKINIVIPKLNKEDEDKTIKDIINGN